MRRLGLSGVADSVLESCPENPAFDVQGESSRAAWVFWMFADAPERPRFSAAMLDALERLEDEFDMAYLSGLAAFLAKRSIARIDLKGYICSRGKA